MTDYRAQPIRALARAITVVLALGLTAPAWAGDLSISEPRVRWLPGDLPLAGYFELTNTGNEARRLTGAASDAFGRVMIHRSVQADGQSRMEHVGEVIVAPGKGVSFAPGGLHLMLMKRQAELGPGDAVPIELRFDDGERLTVDFRVVGADAQ